MKVIYHLGAHCTDDDRLLRTLLKNRGRLAEAGTAVPGPGRYRQMLREALNALKGDPPSDEVIGFVQEAVLETEAATRLVLSNEQFMGGPARAMDEGMLYPGGPERVAELVRMFPRADAELYFGMCNPATFLPLVHARIDGLNWRDFISGCDPMTLRWSDMIARLQDANPGIPITVWCNEDAPVIWPELIRAIGGLSISAPIGGGYDMIGSVMSEPGLRRMRAWIDAKQPMMPRTRRKIMGVFLEKYALPEAMAIEIDRPGWTQTYIDALTESYERDLLRIHEMPGVTLLLP